MLFNEGKKTSDNNGGNRLFILLWSFIGMVFGAIVVNFDLASMSAFIDGLGYESLTEKTMWFFYVKGKFSVEAHVISDAMFIASTMAVYKAEFSGKLWKSGTWWDWEAINTRKCFYLLVWFFIIMGNMTAEALFRAGGWALLDWHHWAYALLFMTFLSEVLFVWSSLMFFDSILFVFDSWNPFNMNPYYKEPKKQPTHKKQKKQPTHMKPKDNPVHRPHQPTHKATTSKPPRATTSYGKPEQATMFPMSSPGKPYSND